MENIIKIDDLLPAVMAEKLEEIGVTKAKMGFRRNFIFALLAFAFIGFGAIFTTTVTTGSTLYWGLTKLVGGLAFSLGLILVIIAGAELFTGNNLISVPWASGRIRTYHVMRNWVIVYFGNMVGTVALVVQFWLEWSVGSNLCELKNSLLDYLGCLREKNTRRYTKKSMRDTE